MNHTQQSPGLGRKTDRTQMRMAWPKSAGKMNPKRNFRNSEEAPKARAHVKKKQEFKKKKEFFKALRN